MDRRTWLDAWKVPLLHGPFRGLSRKTRLPPQLGADKRRRVEPCERQPREAARLSHRSRQDAPAWPDIGFELAPGLLRRNRSAGRKAKIVDNFLLTILA